MAEDRERPMMAWVDEGAGDWSRTDRDGTRWTVCPDRPGVWSLCMRRDGRRVVTEHPTEQAAKLAAIPRVSEDDWFYLLRFPDGTVVQCAGDWDVAHKHLRAIRADWDGDTVPTLIGAYGPNRVGGPEGRGGVYSYGYSPNLIGSIDHPREDWIPA